MFTCGCDGLPVLGCFGLFLWLLTCLLFGLLVVFALVCDFAV